MSDGHALRQRKQQVDDVLVLPGWDGIEGLFVADGAEFEQAFLGVTPWGLRRLYVMLDIESPRRGSGNSFQMARVRAASCGSDDLQILKSAIKDPQAIGLPSVGVWRTLE